jgi:RNA polymerase sigma factor (sigma-70 family)
MKEEFQQLVDEHYAALYRFAYSMAKNRERASDLVQQTFCIWAQKNHQLKDRSSAKTWLFTTLYREQLNYSRRSSKFPEQDIADFDYQLPSEETDTARILDGRRAVALLHALEDIYRTPLTLFYIQQHSYKEIAQILDVPTGTVMSRISRGKKQLREQMDLVMQDDKLVTFQKTQG